MSKNTPEPIARKSLLCVLRLSQTCLSVMQVLDGGAHDDATTTPPNNVAYIHAYVYICDACSNVCVCDGAIIFTLNAVFLKQSFSFLFSSQFSAALLCLAYSFLMLSTNVMT